MDTVKFSKVIKLAIIAAILYLAMYSIPQGLKLLYPLHFKKAIVEYSLKYDMDAALVAAVIKTESNFFTFAESKKGARGLMQITPSTGKWIAEKLGVSEYTDDLLFQPDVNILFGCWYLDHLKNSFGGDIKLTLAAYNGGRGNVDKWLKDASLSSDGKSLDVIPFKETEEFVKRVNRHYRVYSRLYNWTKITEDGE